MKKYFLYIILLFLPFSAVLAAQPNDKKAERIVKNAIDKFQSGGYECGFTMTYLDGQKSVKESKIGKCILDNQKFYFTMSDITTFYDGKTQWVYMSNANEVTISEPTPDELKDSNPLMMMQKYTKNHHIVFDDEQKNDKWYSINLYPNDKNAEYFRINIHVSKSKNLPLELNIWQKDGDKIIFSWTNIKKVKPSPNTFTFIKSQYPHVTVNDLR